MDGLPFIPPRRPTGPMGFLNYPPEILSKIYMSIFNDPDQILVFLCSTSSLLQRRVLKRFPNGRSTLSNSPDIYWNDLRSFVDGTGLSSQLLRVCRKIWSEGTPVLYGNLKIAVRQGPQPDPCIFAYFQRNVRHVLASARFITIRTHLPMVNETMDLYLYRIFHPKRSISCIRRQYLSD